MFEQLKKPNFYLEITLILVVAALGCLLSKMHGLMIILSFFFLPVVLSGFFLGRYHAAMMALWCFTVALLALGVTDFASVGFLEIAVWGAVLGLTALLVGILGEERNKKMNDLREAYLGVAEVLAIHIQSGDPDLKARAVRVAELARKIAEELQLPQQEREDIRVAALLPGPENVEATKAIRRALDTLKAEVAKPGRDKSKSFDLPEALGPVLNSNLSPLVERVIRTARAFDGLTECDLGGPPLSTAEAVKELETSTRDGGEQDEVLNALRYVVSPTTESFERETAAV